MSLAFWHVAACRKRPVADDDTAADLQETGIVVMGAALFMSRWQQVGPAADVSHPSHLCAPESQAIVSWHPRLSCVSHMKYNPSSTAPQTATTLLAAFIARHHHVRGVESLHHNDAQVWYEAPQVKTLGNFL